MFLALLSKILQTKHRKKFGYWPEERRPLLWNKNCNKLDIDTCKQLKILGDLYNDYNIKSHGFDNFFVKEIIAIKKAMILLLFLLPIGCKSNAEY